MGFTMLGLITAFGGGAIRNILIGVPIIQLWQQTTLLVIAILTITILILLPYHFIAKLKEWETS
ncbi:TRIC cation channel family protein [Anaerobacillus sp. HL2]|nr:TRIC cation channel family protein [Anaerobacillus sp. HL2]